ncbi:perforin-1-like [Salarias fasciatus]|uniref:Perforin-1-like n=1 Tax=Salarias fasciatus TaxID=181472 RepID=A0A672I7G4_SALFA|nr:perforin-1-like [Salarias fasciatus]
MVALWYVLLVCWAWPPPCQTSGVPFVGSPQECAQTPFVPGYNLGGEGFDIVTMERKGAYVIDTETWNLGNGTCRLYQNSYMKNEKQKVPAAVLDWRTLPKCSLKVSSLSYYSAESVMNDSTSSVSNNWKIGLDIQNKLIGAGICLGGSHSRESTFASQKSKEDRYEFFRHSVHCNLYRYRLKANPPLSPEFQAAINALSSSFPDKQLLYQSLIDTYGTHFITQVYLGGEMKATTGVRTCQASLSGVSATEIKDCLFVEASVHFPASVSINSMTEHCRAKKAKLGHGSSFSTLFNERISEVIGGNIGESDILFQGQSSNAAINNWVASLRTTPDIIQYTLNPLHTILPSQHPARDRLKREVEKHIMKNAVSTKCSEPCAIGRKSSKRDPCACVCHNNQNMKPNCCPAGTGFATLEVFNLYATDLYGDRFTQTDGLVQVDYGSRIARTSIITDDDNPRWPETFDFGTIQITMKDQLTFEVYDSDSSWNSDLLGRCSFALRSGAVSDSCMFEYGTFFFSYAVKCSPSLGGDRCQEYIPSPMSSSLASQFYSRNGVLVGEGLER